MMLEERQCQEALEQHLRLVAERKQDQERSRSQHSKIASKRVDRAVYQEAMFLLAKRVKRPTQDELVRILQSELEVAEWRLEQKIQERTNWIQKRSDLSQIGSLSQHYFDQ